MSPLSCALFGTLVSVMAVMCNGCCTRGDSAVAVVYDGAFLLKELTTSNQANSTDWFLPNPSMATDPTIFTTVSNLVAMMKQRSSLERLQDSDTVTVLRRVLDAVINDSCQYLNEEFGLTMDDSDVSEIEDLHTRLQIVKTFFDTEGVLQSNSSYLGFSTGGKGYRYSYWNDSVNSSCGSTCARLERMLFRRFDRCIC